VEPITREANELARRPGSGRKRELDKTMNFRALPAGLLLIAATAAGCSRADMLASLESGPASQAVLIGDGQQASAGSELPSPVTVKVLDSVGRPVPGQMVKFVVTAGGGEVFAGVALTNEEGMAAEWWTLGSAPGVNLLEARAIESPTSAGIALGSFSATGY
jgi:hypothetical protein